MSFVCYICNSMSWINMCFRKYVEMAFLVLELWQHCLCQIVTVVCARLTVK